jgi:hypothetical protein
MNKNQNLNQNNETVSAIYYTQKFLRNISDLSELSTSSNNHNQAISFCSSFNMFAYSATITTNLKNIITTEDKIKLIPNINHSGDQTKTENQKSVILELTDNSNYADIDSKYLNFQLKSEIHSTDITYMSVLKEQTLKNTSGDLEKRLLTIFDSSSRKTKINLMRNVKYYEWNPVTSGRLLIITEKNMVIWDTEDNKEFLFNFYLPEFEGDSREYVLNAHWSYNGKLIIAITDRNNTMIFDDECSLVRSFKDECIEQVIFLQEKTMFFFACGNNNKNRKFEISCLDLTEANEVIKTKYQPIDDFYHGSRDVFIFYDPQNFLIYINKKYQRVIHCLSYNKKTHSIIWNQIIDIKMDILHISMSSNAVLNREDLEIAR